MASRTSRIKRVRRLARNGKRRFSLVTAPIAPAPELGFTLMLIFSMRAAARRYRSPVARPEVREPRPQVARPHGPDPISLTGRKVHDGKPERRNGLDHFHQLLKIGRLGNIAVGIQVIGSKNVLLRLRAGQDDNRDLF